MPEKKRISAKGLDYHKAEVVAGRRCADQAAPRRKF